MTATWITLPLLSLCPAADDPRDAAALAADLVLREGDAAAIRATADATPDSLLLAAEDRILAVAAEARAADRITLAARLARLAETLRAPGGEASEGGASEGGTSAPLPGGDRAGLAARFDHLEDLARSLPIEVARDLLARRARIDRLVDDLGFDAALQETNAARVIAATAALPGWAVRLDLRALDVLASLYRENDVREAAEAVLRRTEDGPFRLARAEALARRAQSEHARGEVDAAERSVVAALEIARRYPPSSTLAFAADEGGWIAHGRAAFGLAIARFRESAAAAEAAGDLDRLARARRSLAVLLDVIGRSEEALDAMDAAMDAARAAGRPWRIADTAMHVAELRHRHGQTTRARERLAEAEEAIARLFIRDAWMESRRLRLAFEIEDPGPARRAALREEAARLLERVPFRDRFPLLQVLAEDARRRGDAAEAVAFADELVRTAGVGGPSAERRAWGTLARCRESAGDLEGSLAAAGEALALAEGLRPQIADLHVEDRMAAGRSARQDATFATRVAADLHDALPPGAARGALAERALLFLDFGRARTLLDELGARSATNLAGRDDARADPPRYGRGTGADGEPPAPLPRQGLPREALAPLGLTPGAWNASRALLLGPSDVVLAYDLGARVAIGATREETRLVRLPAEEDLERAVDFARHALRELRDPVAFRAPAAALSRALLAPFEDLLARTDRVLCLPSGALHLLPLDLLPRHPDDAATSAVGPAPLFATHAVEHVPGLGTLVPFAPERDTPTHARVFAFSPDDAGPALPAVDAEARAVAARFVAPRTALVATGADAQEAALKRYRAAPRDVLHLAAHAWADPIRGARSGVRLAAGDGDDGRLHAEEILTLDLPVALAVVSGCEGGHGEELGAEGVLSVGFALLAAGARAALVSVDRVEDGVPQRLLGPFYAAVLAGEDPARALASTRRALAAAGDEASRLAAFEPFLIVGRYGGATR